MKYSKPLYDVLGVYIPLSVLLLWAPLSGIALRFFAAGYFVSGAPGWKTWCAFGFLSAIAASVYSSIMNSSIGGHKAADIRGGIIAAVAAYLSLLLLDADLPLASRFLPSVNSVVSALVSFFMWFSVISVRKIFREIELFESFTTQYREEQLREMMREFSPEMSLADKNLKQLMISYALQFVPPFLFVTAAGSSRVPLPMIVLTLLLFCAGFLLAGFLGLIRRELAYASEGLSFTARDTSLPLSVMALGIGGAALIALAVSSDSSLLPPGVILAVLMYLGRLLTALFPPPGVEEFAQTGGIEQPSAQSTAEPFPIVAINGPWPGWKYVKLFFAAAAVFFFLYFMIYPLLRRSGYLIKIKSIGEAIVRWFTDLGKSIAVFFAALWDHGTSLQMKQLDKEKLRHISSELLSGGIKRKEAERSVNLFARLILWGIENAGVSWKSSFAPGEYCAILAAAIQVPGELNRDAAEKSSAVIRCGELFEKALYSPRPLSAKEENDFRQTVETITEFSPGGKITP